MNFDDLDCRQRSVIDEVIQAGSRVMAIGGPGTGKTTTALWAARRYLESTDDCPKPRVLFLTFSRSAIRQIRSRSPGVLAKLEERVEVMTFHSLAFRLLQSFGRYAGHGTAPLTVQSETRTKLLGYDGTRLRYDDLMPEAIRMLAGSERIRELVASRWGLVICDESQDCDEKQWSLIELLRPPRLLLLGDANQMIYTFIPGVSLERFNALQASVDKVIELLPRSYRDPSGAIPAVAEAIRLRQFDDPAVVQAVKDGRLTLIFDVEADERPDILVAEIRRARKLLSRDVGVFAHSNAAVAELAEAIDAAGVDHVLIGLPEAHAEALGAMAMQCAFAAGLSTDQEVRESLALFLTGSIRSRSAPAMARALIGDGTLPELVNNGIVALEGALVEAANGTIGDVADVAMKSWFGLALIPAVKIWSRAAAHFGRLVTPIKNEAFSEDSVQSLLDVVERGRNAALIEGEYAEDGRVKLMNYHQTKGREADTVIHVFRPDDFFGDEEEPFEVGSRLLNVAISRARDRVVILLPTLPHALVEPFAALSKIGRFGHHHRALPLHRAGP